MINGNNRLPLVTIAGAFQNGKSTLVNCLLDDQYAPMGKGLRTTACCSYFFYGEAEIAKLVHEGKKEEVLERREIIFDPSFTCSGKDHLEISCWKPLLQKAVLADTPGFEANKQDDEAAMYAIKNSEIVVFVHDTRQLDESARQILSMVRKEGKRLLFLLNCKDEQHWHPADKKNMDLAQVLENQLAEMGWNESLLCIQGRKVWTCNPVFAWYALGHLQRDLDNCNESIRKDAETQIDTIKFFCKKQSKKDSGWTDVKIKELLLATSGILEIRRAIENAAMVPIINLCTNPMGELKALTEKWSAQIKTHFN